MYFKNLIFFSWIFDICTHASVLEAVKEILGPNIVLLSTCLITKYPVKEKIDDFKGHFVGWHQDLEYCGLVNIEPNNEKPLLITMWLAIDMV